VKKLSRICGWGLLASLCVLIFYSTCIRKPTPEEARVSAEQQKKEEVVREQREQQAVREQQEKADKEAADAKAAEDAKDLEDTQNKAVLLTMRVVKQSLHDPDSVQWADAAVSPDVKVVCVTYRARNGFGGMGAGFVVFAGAAFSQSEKVWNANCQRNDLINKHNVVYSVNKGYASVD
jgi:hypothetical protein